EQSGVIQALQTVANKLSYRQVQEVVRWSRLVLQSQLQLVHLQGDRLIKVQAPCSDVPSILDLPSLDEGNNYDRYSLF
ncbi:hypothetical protein ACN4EG_27340, partial [Alkalinema pantanalense CENA528]|uniref:hypothetical protein n=1 Tax=Alkalinema pantanalense TaxID=1620705 RepID=UPI003D6EE8CB